MLFSRFVPSLLLLAALCSPAFAQGFKKELDAPEKVSLSVKNRDGRVSVVASDEQQKKVTIDAKSTGSPVDFASIVTFFCCSSEATTLTRPSMFLTDSETFSGASSSFLKPWAKAGKHKAARSSSDGTNLLNNIASDLARSRAGGQAQPQFPRLSGPYRL